MAIAVHSGEAHSWIERMTALPRARALPKEVTNLSAAKLPAPPEPSWRGSSYDLKHGLDVVELPTTLPVDVLDRLFSAPGK